jgi:TRAP-type mannitol/chloroaromatic compound transport system permease small subunit
MVVVQFVVVGMRYVFGVPSIFLQESIVYMHALIFMIGAGYTLLHDGHVRIDIFYGDATPKRRAVVNLAGVLILLLPISVMIWYVSWNYVSMAWMSREGSVEVSGIQGIYLLKTVILVFATLVAVQGISLGIRSLLTLMGIEPTTSAEQA